MSSDIIFEMRNIVKSFYGFTVLKNMSLDFRRGEIHCLVGENGAGKSTLIKILSGVYQPTSGEIFYKGEKVEFNTPFKAMQAGIQTIYQEHAVFPTLSVTENLFAGNEIVNGVVVNKKEMREKTKEMLKYLNCSFSPDTIVGTLTDSEQKLVEIARGLIRESQLFILDEPTSSFGRHEIEFLFEVLNRMRENGKSIIYISHHLEETFEIADRITVIKDGEKINTYNNGEVDKQVIISDMVGREVSMFYSREEVETGDVMFEVENLSGNGVEDISFQIHQGEILGFSGMVGSGRTEMAELIFGVVPKKSGIIKINGETVDIKNPNQAYKHKMCFLTESRQHTGLFLPHTIKENINISNYMVRENRFVFEKEDVALAEKYRKDLNIATTSVYKKVIELSGGNQQKVVLGKLFATDGDIFIFDEPTKGVDVGAKEEIYKIMTELIKNQKCILLISSDLPELISLSNRILVMRDGHITKEIPKAEATEENVLKYAIS